MPVRSGGVVVRFEEVLNESVTMVKRQGRVSYRSVQCQFDLDDTYIADVKEALLYTHAEVISDDGRGLVWTGEPQPPLPNAQPDTDWEKRGMQSRPKHWRSPLYSTRPSSQGFGSHVLIWKSPD